MRYLDPVAIALALAGSIVFPLGISTYLGGGTGSVAFLTLIMIATGLLCLAAAVLLGRLTARVVVGVIVLIDGIEIFESYTCGGFGPVCFTWWDGQAIGLLTILFGLATAIWGAAERFRPRANA